MDSLERISANAASRPEQLIASLIDEQDSLRPFQPRKSLAESTIENAVSATNTQFSLPTLNLIGNWASGKQPGTDNDWSHPSANYQTTFMAEMGAPTNSHPQEVKPAPNSEPERSADSNRPKEQNAGVQAPEAIKVNPQEVAERTDESIIRLRKLVDQNGGPTWNALRALTAEEVNDPLSFFEKKLAILNKEERLIKALNSSSELSAEQLDELKMIRAAIKKALVGEYDPFGSALEAARQINQVEVRAAAEAVRALDNNPQLTVKQKQQIEQLRTDLVFVKDAEAITLANKALASLRLNRKIAAGSDDGIIILENILNLREDRQYDGARLPNLLDDPNFTRKLQMLPGGNELLADLSSRVKLLKERKN